LRPLHGPTLSAESLLAERGGGQAGEGGETSGERFVEADNLRLSLE